MPVEIINAILWISLVLGTSVAAASTPVSSPDVGVLPLPNELVRARDIGFGFSALHGYSYEVDPFGYVSIVDFRGEFRNDTDRGRPVPVLTLSFVDADGRLLGLCNGDQTHTDLAPGERATFTITGRCWGSTTRSRSSH